MIARCLRPPLQAQAIWSRGSQIFGLKENLNKIKFYHRAAKGRRQLIQAGADPKRVFDAPEILGANLVETQKGTLVAAESKRLNKARKLADRSKCNLLSRWELSVGMLRDPAVMT